LIRRSAVHWLWIAAAGATTAASGHAQAHCPWLNVATASGMLNGPAILDVQKPSPDETVCAFRYTVQGTVYSLQIDVRLHQDISRGLGSESSVCTSPGAALRAIGNEANICAEDSKSLHSDVVIGRVRDSIFRVSVSTSARNDPAMPRDALEQKAKDTAEQVAGALF
jgi:hypothetical protein